MIPVVHTIDRYSYRFISVGRSCVLSYHTIVRRIIHIFRTLSSCNRVRSLLLLYYTFFYNQNDHAGYELRVLLAEPLHRSGDKNARYHILIIRTYNESRITVVVPHLRERWVFNIAYCQPQLPVVVWPLKSLSNTRCVLVSNYIAIPYMFSKCMRTYPAT